MLRYGAWLVGFVIPAATLVGAASRCPGADAGVATPDAVMGFRQDGGRELECNDPSVAVWVPAESSRTVIQAEAAYARMPPVTYSPPADRWKALPRSEAVLRRGTGQFNIVMVGDSIINDTSRSRWEDFLSRRVPGPIITKTTAVRGSTGCWWYKERPRVQCYILRYKPDLLILGGVSQKDDIESIRDVVMQVRAQSNCDILLMTKAFGGLDPSRPWWSFAFDPKGSDYRARLKRLADELNVGFLDMTAYWGAYVLKSGHPVGWFMRDAVHANEMGEQILGRILVSHFTP